MPKAIHDKVALKASAHMKEEILRRLHSDSRLTQRDIAGMVGLTEFAVSKLLSRVSPLYRHARRIAKGLNMPVAELTGLTEKQVEEHIPPEVDPNKPGRKPSSQASMPTPGQPSATVVAKWVGRLRAQGGGTSTDRIPLRRGSEIIRIDGDDSRTVPTYILVGPSGVDPMPGEKAFVRTDDGRKLIRRFSTDETDPNLLVLMQLKDGNGLPLVIHRDQVKEMRAILGTLATDEME